MDEGRIKEIGTHAELIEKSGYYRRLYDMQFNRNPEEPGAEVEVPPRPRSRGYTLPREPGSTTPSGDGRNNPRHQSVARASRKNELS